MTEDCAMRVWTGWLALGLLCGAVAAERAAENAPRLPAPEAAAGYAGTLDGSVAAVEWNGKWVNLRVAKVDPADAKGQALVGQTVSLTIGWSKGAGGLKPDPVGLAYVKSLTPGQDLSVKVKSDRRGNLRLSVPPNVRAPAPAGPAGAVSAATDGGNVERGGTPLAEATDPLYVRLREELSGLPPGWLVLGVDQAAAAARFGRLSGPGRAELVEPKIENGDPPFSCAWRVHTEKQTPKPWDVQMRATNPVGVKKGDLLYVTYWARAYESPNEAGDATAYLVIKSDAAGAKGELASASKPFVESEWQRYGVHFKAERDFAPETIRFEWFFGLQPQQIEMAGYTVVNFGPGADPAKLPTPVPKLDYEGRAPDAPWRKDALERIERIRKADLKVEVVDTEGRPVAGAEVRVAQTRQAFVFGTTVDGQVWAGREDAKIPAKKQDAYRKLIASGMFNRVSLGNDLKWPAWDGVWRGFRRERTLAAIDDLNARGIPVKGHVLTWGFWHADPEAKGLKDDPKALQAHILDHIRGIVAATKGRLVVWDVVNEHATYNEFTTICGDAAAVEWFRAARETDPKPRLFWNEATRPGAKASRLRDEHTLRWCRYLKEQGAPIDGIGLECHYSMNGLTGPESIAAQLRKYAEIGLDIEATEFDIDVQNPKDAAQQALQADFLRDFLIVFFAEPRVTGVTYWTPTVAKWKPNAALSDADLRLRPHGEVWRELVTHTWRTDARAVADAEGRAVVRGFLGDYHVTAAAGSLTGEARVTLGADGSSVRVALAAAR